MVLFGGDSPSPGLRVLPANSGIENRLHGMRDVNVRDDPINLRTDNGPKNMAKINQMAMIPLRSNAGQDRLKARRKAARWDQNSLITGTVQSPSGDSPGHRGIWHRHQPAQHPFG